MPLLLADPPQAPPPICREPPRGATRWLVIGAVALCLIPLGWESYRVVLGDNSHEVVPGKVYRCAQPDAQKLRAIVEKHGIRTVINLRGACPLSAWYGPECQVLDELRVARHDVPLSSAGLPAVAEFRRLAAALEGCSYPVLLHCRRGADRTGLVSALCRLLHTEDDVPAARQQLSLRYGHFPIGETAVLHQVLDMYEEWLARKGTPHRPELLRQWVLNDYKPAHRWAELEPLEAPEQLPFGRPVAARFRVHNRSESVWRLAKEPNRGVHLMCLIRKPDLSQAWLDGAGFFEAVVPPGGSIELTLALPAIRTPGKYIMTVDMADPDGGWFFLTGSPRFEREIEVRQHDANTDAETRGRGDAEKPKL